MPLGALITGANANEGCQTQHLLACLVVRPPEAEVPVQSMDLQSCPTAQGDGAYGNQPTRQRAEEAGFRLRAPSRRHPQPGLGRVRGAVERCHNFFAQFGRIARRLDRSASRYLAWVHLAAVIIFIRSGFVP
jgi:transposase